MSCFFQELFPLLYFYHKVQWVDIVLGKRDISICTELPLALIFLIPCLLIQHEEVQFFRRPDQGKEDIFFLLKSKLKFELSFILIQKIGERFAIRKFNIFCTLFDGPQGEFTII